MSLQLLQPRVLLPQPQQSEAFFFPSLHERQVAWQVTAPVLHTPK